jgi:hypothetical protein
MQDYEIRLVRKSGPTVLSSRYISDYAALRSARLMAAPDDRIEIWRGRECIYHDQPLDGRLRYA